MHNDWWEEAVKRQYSTWNTLVSFLITALALTGSLAVGLNKSLPDLQKWLFTLASITTLITACLLIVITHLERSINWTAGNRKLQEIENKVRLGLEIMLPVSVFLVLISANLMIWSVSN